MITETQKKIALDLGVRTRFDSFNLEDHWMTAGDMKVGLNMPDALLDRKDGSEHDLPPFRRRKSFLVDEYPGCPSEWPRSEGSQISYFVPVIKDKGMWLDFNPCSEAVHEVAIVVSIQGINAITGLPSEDVVLEQYKEECPKHKVKFGPHRFCEKCGYRWPKQNYLSTTSTPEGNLWLDGFRSGDGVVRQYLLTEERLRGVAAAIVGERRVHAIGISFFLSKAMKPKHDIVLERREIIYGGQPNFFSPVHTPVNWQVGKDSTADYKGYDQYLTICDSENVTTSSSSYSTGSSSSSSKSFKTGKSGHSVWKRVNKKIEAPDLVCGYHVNRYRGGRPY
jgi:hypothetical protein